MRAVLFAHDASLASLLDDIAALDVLSEPAAHFLVDVLRMTTEVADTRQVLHVPRRALQVLARMSHAYAGRFVGAVAPAMRTVTAAWFDDNCALQLATLLGTVSHADPQAVFDAAGATRWVVQTLDASRPRLASKLANVVSNLAYLPAAVDEMLQFGVATHLLACLDGAASPSILLALRNLVDELRGARAVQAAGGVRRLVLHLNHVNAQAATDAAAALSNLLHIAVTEAEVLDALSVSPLVMPSHGTHDRLSARLLPLALRRVDTAMLSSASSSLATAVRVAEALHAPDSRLARARGRLQAMQDCAAAEAARLARWRAIGVPAPQWPAEFLCPILIEARRLLPALPPCAP